VPKARELTETREPKAPAMQVKGKVYQFVSGPDDPTERLDKFVVARLAAEGRACSRAAVQRWIRAGTVKLGGRPAAASDSVSLGAVVEVAPMAPEPTELEPDASVVFDVLFEDAHLIVVDKPGGLVVHPARGHAKKTLVHGLLARGSFPKVMDATVRPGIVHRLDKGTSGILVVAKDERTREGLKAQFMRHDIERAYLAIVAGRAEDRTFDTLHGRHRTDRLRFTSRVTKGKRAVTRVRVLERFSGPGQQAKGVDLATLVECRLETGRTHQIRVHLLECAATPIVGDPLYGRALRDPLLRQVGDQLGRQALHAFVLGFVHPVTHEKLRFQREPPRDFMAALEALRAKPGPRPAQ
jgi:23S rRNA pseudouridine1911/1915/1917 synthase